MLPRTFARKLLLAFSLSNTEYFIGWKIDDYQNEKRLKMHKFQSVICVLLLLLITGCGGSEDTPKLAQVTGTLSDGDKPIPNAAVLFQPEDGSPSSGTTDKQGKFTLEYSTGEPGATIGEHTVKFTIGGIASSEGEVDLTLQEAPQQVKEPVEIVLPGKKTVAEGENSFSFDLADYR